MSPMPGGLWELTSLNTTMVSGFPTLLGKRVKEVAGVQVSLKFIDLKKNIYILGYTKVVMGHERNIWPSSPFADSSFPWGHSLRSHIEPRLMPLGREHLGFRGFPSLSLIALPQRLFTAFSTLD